MEQVKCPACNSTDITTILTDYDSQEYVFVCLDCGKEFPADDRIANFE